LFSAINLQLETNQIIVKTGAIIGASVIDTPFRPKGKSEHKVTEDRTGEQEVEVVKKYVSHVIVRDYNRCR
jgi:IS5 family transposase